MAESSTVTILRNKCVEIEHRISAYEREIEIARKNLVAVQMTLAVFQSDPNAPYHAQRPVSLSKLFRRNELPAVIFGALRDASDGLDNPRVGRHLPQASRSRHGRRCPPPIHGDEDRQHAR